MPPSMNCPVCESDMRSRSLLSGYSLRSYRVCPDCGSKYTADAATRRRQYGLLVLVLVALGLTLAVPLYGIGWLPVIAAHVAVWAFIAYILSKLAYVPYED